MSKQVKQMVITELQKRIGDETNFLVVNLAKVDAVTTNKMRIALREKNIAALTVKNALASVALRQNGVTALDGVLEGPSTLVWGGEDIVALSKEIAKWAKDIATLEIKGGVAEGAALSSADVDSLSKSAGRIETLGEIVTLMLSPGRQLGALLLGPGGKISGQLKALAEKEASGEEASVEATPAAE
ncbi:MAG: 50S ribosomal protein L10 [Planctomycetota bacterium]|nr:50S ribosomal protein L10 [Planctomycetota bacterium]